MKECVATAKFMVEKKNVKQYTSKRHIIMYIYYEPVICMPRLLGTRDTRDIAGLKCRDLTYDVSPQCRECVEVLISRLNRPLLKEFV